MTGGMNIGNDYAINWQDSLTTFKGPVVAAMDKEFAHDWQLAGGTPYQPLSPTPAAGTVPAQVLLTSPTDPGRDRQVKVATLAAIDAAQTSISLENPYFSDLDLVDHLQAAVKRGVEVKIVLPQGNDEPLYTQINAQAVAPLQQQGAKVWLVDTGVNALHFNHTKLMVVDDQWVLSGSANADPRAYENNQELSIGVTDPALAQDADKRVFDAHIQHSIVAPAPAPPPNASLIELAGSIL